MSHELADIRRRAARIAAQQEQLRQAVLVAADAGLPLQEIADAARVTRVTVWRWREESKALVHARDE